LLLAIMSLAKLTHQFIEKTYHKWTFCDHCNKLLWGLVKQGVECTECGFISHKKCLDHITYSCDHLFSASTTLTEEDLDTSREVLFFETENNSELPVSDTEVSLIKRTPSRFQRVTSKSEGLPQSPPPRSPTSGIIQDLIVSTAAKSIEIQKNLTKPELSLAANGKNFARFTVRAAVLANLQDTVESIFTWQQPSVTLLCMVAYGFVCIYPAIILMLPYILLVQIIVQNYFHRAQRIAQANGRPLSSLPPEPSPIVKIGSAQYRRNLTFIQNSMGMFADHFDAVRAQFIHFDWSDEEHTMNILKAVLAAWVATVVAVYFVPWNYILLMVGEAAFVANTPLAQAFADTVMPKILAALKVRLYGMKKRFNGRVPSIRVDTPEKDSQSHMAKAKTVA
jgi:hypothetical protein